MSRYYPFRQRIFAALTIIAVIIAGLFTTGIASVQTVHAAMTYTVSDPGDTDCATPPTFAPATLRCAIRLANSGDSITFALPAPYKITLTSRMLSISRSITIDGSNGGNPVIVDGNGSYTAFTVISGPTVAVQALTIQNGHDGVAGGAVFNDGTLTIANSTLSGNSTSNAGGAVFNAGTLTIANSTISGNSAGIGGGVYNAGTLTIANSAISGNSAGIGGGVYNAGRLTISSSTIAANFAGIGGGVYNAGTLTISSSTIAANSAGIGGGVLNTSTLNILSTIVAKNSGPNPDVLGSVTSLGHNLIGDGTGSAGITNGAKNDQVGTGISPINPLLGILQYNGGLTQTEAIMSGSPAYQAGNCTGSGPVPAVIADQRTVTRKPNCDVGAYEVQPSPQPLAVNSLSDDQTPGGACAQMGTYCLRNEVVIANSFGTAFTPPAVNPDAVKITFTVNGQITLTGTELLLSGNSNLITIDGASKVTVDGNAASRIFNVGSGATVALKALTIQNGAGNLGGGGVYNNGTLAIGNSTLLGNVATNGSGGGIYNANSGNLTITSSTLSGNSTILGYGGGGIFNGGTLTLGNSTFSTNSAYSGGGIYNIGGLTINNSTFSGNSANTAGGVFNNPGLAKLTLLSDIVAGNTVSGLGSADPDIFGSVTSLGHNLIGDGTGAIGVANGSNNDQVGTGGAPIVPKLDTSLKNNGGTTQTLALLSASSPAYQTGNCAGSGAIAAVAVDQRGNARKSPACDIGAFELPFVAPTATPGASGSSGTGSGVQVADPLLAKSADLSLAQPGEVVHFTLTVSNPGGQAAQGVVVTDPLPALLTPQSATATQGTFAINGNTVTFNVETVAPGQTITLTITATVTASVKPPIDLTNTASLIDGQGHTSSASTTIHVTAGNLPSTGEHP